MTDLLAPPVLGTVRTDLTPAGLALARTAVEAAGYAILDQLRSSATRSVVDRDDAGRVIRVRFPYRNGGEGSLACHPTGEEGRFDPLCVVLHHADHSIELDAGVNVAKGMAEPFLPREPHQSDPSRNVMETVRILIGAIDAATTTPYVPTDDDRLLALGLGFDEDDAPSDRGVCHATLVGPSDLSPGHLRIERATFRTERHEAGFPARTRLEGSARPGDGTSPTQVSLALAAIRTRVRLDDVGVVERMRSLAAAGRPAR